MSQQQGGGQRFWLLFKTGLIGLTKVLFEKYYHKVLIAIIWFQSFLLILLKKWTPILCLNNDLKPKLHLGYNLLVLLTVSSHSKKISSFSQRGIVFKTVEEEWIKHYIYLVSYRSIKTKRYYKHQFSSESVNEMRNLEVIYIN
jgi:hypothetical protein